ncbi:MAG TPA: tyrosine-protein phosphatase [Rectinemataceae bacterium]|nr:tyrosine-protein phosphatase [Rectinemataceae bacterium]
MQQTKRIALSLWALAIMALVLPMTVLALGADQTVVGTVVEVQKYGNLAMDIKPKALYDAGFALGDILNVAVGGKALEIPFCTSYSDVDTGSLVLRDDRTDNLLIVAVNMGNFSTTYDVKVGATLAFTLAKKAGYLSEYLLRQLKRGNVRSEYATDSIFANFRSLATTGIEPGLAYRSSNPVNNEIGRAAYADALAKAVGIRTVLNLSDSDKDIEGYFAAPGFKSDYYKSLYEAGRVKALNMGVDLSSPQFGAKLAEGLRFLIEHEGPYLFHCTEGKDRAGFLSAVLESLMGAGLDEVVSDYMASYENYYGVKQGSDQYTAIANSNIVASMTMVVCGLPKGTDISKVDLAAAAKAYLERIGLSSGEIAALKARLSAASVYKVPNVSGTVTQIEKYGHALTDITIRRFDDLGFKFGDMATVVFDNGFVLEAPYLDGYYVNNGAPLIRAYPGQTDIAVCINYGKLNAIAKVDVGSKFAIMLSAPSAYLAQYEIRKLVRTNKRGDYASDEVFANFRSIALGRIAEGVLYRSSSPIDDQLGRAAYADRLMKEAGVKAVVNLSDAADNMKTYLAAKDFASPYYAGLSRDGRVLFLNMNLAFASDDFRAKVVEGLVFMADHDGPYLFHCTEGKDRTGFFAALVEALMGASKDRIVEDYMQSYVDYYGVKQGSEQYKLISQDVLGMLKVIAGADDPEKADLASGAKKYLLSGGMTAGQIETLMRKLSKRAAVSESGGVQRIFAASGEASDIRGWPDSRAS